LLLLILVSYLGYVITWRVIRAILIPIMQRSKTQFDDLLIKHRFFRKLAYLVPALMLYYFTEDTITIPILITVIRKLLENTKQTLMELSIFANSTALPLSKKEFAFLQLQKEKEMTHP